MTELVLREVSGAVTRITLNDAGTRNSLSLAMIEALRRELSNTASPVIILAAKGPAFCSGHNLKEITAHRQDNDLGQAFFSTLFESCSDLMLDIQQHPAAIIAEVDGLASAAGCQLVATCDLAIASERASFCTPGVNIGLFCSTPMVALSRAVSRKHAMEMLLTGDAISADEALRFGLVNRVVESEQLRQSVEQLAHHIGTKSAEAIRTGKRAFAVQESLERRQAYAAMSQVMIDNLQYDDAKEGISVFIEKRDPTWMKPSNRG